MAGKTTKKSPFDCAAFYTITSKLSGKAVTACGESEVRMFAPTEEECQQWKLVAADDGAYRLISKTTGKALDIMLAGENDGAQLHQWKEDISAPTQSWVLEQTQDGSYKIKSAVSGKCMDIVDISMQDDARLQIWEDLDGENQKWMLNALAAPKPARKPRAPKKETTAKTKAVAEKAATVATEKAASPAKPKAAKPAAAKSTKAEASAPVAKPAATKTPAKALPKTAADKKAKK
ncbi:MAG: RICIN domain-containing protein [Clostridiales bacterium]|nr:RICIN domain-containing protein [Clostridiales bacterium]